MAIKDRIKELKRIRAGDLIPSPRNWRVHPESQVAALRGVLDEVGIADAVLVREVDEGYELIDGHLRADILPDQMMPVLVLDVDEAEADKILATHDPLAGMAEIDEEKLGELLASLDTESEAVAGLLKEIAESMPSIDSAVPPEDFPEVGEDLPTDHLCPKCGYVWSGESCTTPATTQTDS